MSKTRIVAAVAVLLTSAWLAPAAVAAGPTPTPNTTTAGTAWTQQRVNSTLATAKTPMIIEMSVTTGEVTDIVAATTLASPMISNDNICQSSDGCWYSGRIPYANQGFFGSAGTYRGSWPYRSKWGSGSYTASACWTQACSQVRVPPGHIVILSAMSTGTSFTIY